MIQADAERFAEFFSMSLDMLCIAGVDGYFRELNPAWERVLGYTDEELRSRPFLDFVHPEDRDSTAAEAAKLATGAETISFLNRYRARDGGYRWLMWSSRLSRDGVSLLAVARDITDLKETELRLLEATESAQAANAAKSAFLTTVSHELRTPLNSIIGFSKILLKDKPKTLIAGQREFLERIAVNGVRLLSLINDVLDLSKIEAGQLLVEVEPVDLAGPIQRTLRSLEAQARTRGLRLEAVLGDLDPVPADGKRLEQILINLAGNALKFTRSGGVLIRVVGDDRKPLRIDVVDTGIGMAMDEAERLFEAFVQADSSTAREYGGTGLGLAIARALAQMMGFEIVVASIPGQGSTFSVLLDPAAERPTHVTPTLSERPAEAVDELLDEPGPSFPESSPSAGPCVLIIDDEVDSRILLEKVLSDDGYRVVAADNARHGFEIARSLAPDVITLDLMMPSEDGVSLLNRLRAEETTQHIPVVVVSIIGSERRSSLGAAADVIDKPFSIDELKSSLRRVIAAKPRRV